MSRPDNILFITADQWRGDCLSALGHPCLKTPNLDRLAADGTLFTRHYSQATPCGPGRASLYTGLYLMNHRSVINGAPLDARHTNVALEARKAGYDPVLFGYTDVGADPRLHAPGDPNLSTYEGILPGMTAEILLRDNQLSWLADLQAKGYDIPVDGDRVFTRQSSPPGAEARGSTFAPALYRAEDSNTAFLTDGALKHISVRQDRPWFVHLSYLAPHPPFIVAAPYHDLYDPLDTPGPVRARSPEEEASQHPWLDFYLKNQMGTGPTQEDRLTLAGPALGQVRATYYGMMSEVDAQIGRLIDQLKKSGAYERTLIVFTSDHGEQLGDHWMFAKYGYFDQSFHIPLIVHDPRSPAATGRAQRIEQFTENVDVMPTILDWLGLDLPDQCDGLSLLPFCQGETPASWRSEAHWEFDFRNLVTQKFESALGLTSDQCAMNVIRNERYKYVHFTAMPPALYDLQEDPGELRNLADDPGYQAIALDYAQKMLSWRMNHDERVLTVHQLTDRGLVTRLGPRR